MKSNKNILAASLLALGVAGGGVIDDAFDSATKQVEAVENAEIAKVIDPVVETKPEVKAETKVLRFEERHHTADKSLREALSLSRDTTNGDIIAAVKGYQTEIRTLTQRNAELARLNKAAANQMKLLVRQNETQANAIDLLNQRRSEISEQVQR